MKVSSFLFSQFMTVPVIATAGAAGMMTPPAWFSPNLFDKKDVQGYSSGLFITFPTRHGLPIKSNFNA
jgi:hypothetical protein